MTDLTNAPEKPAVASNIQRRTEANTALPAKQPMAVVIRAAIEQQAGRFQAILPAGFDQVRFHNLVLSAVKKKPGLIECFATDEGKVSVLLAAMEAAAAGLEPDTVMEECWLQPVKNKGRQECQLRIGYKGLTKLARQSGEVKSIRADVVRQGDHFHYEYGAERDVLDHKPADSELRGALLYAYAVVRYLNGGYEFVVLDRGEIEARRAKSDSWKNTTSRPYSPWTGATEPSMWKKSALRELSKLMPKSAAMARIEHRDERTLGFDDDGDVTTTDDQPADVLDAESEEVTD